MKARLTVSKHMSPMSTSTGLQTTFWAIWQVGSEIMVQTSVGMLRARMAPGRREKSAVVLKGKSLHFYKVEFHLIFTQTVECGIVAYHLPLNKPGVSYCDSCILQKVRPWRWRRKKCCSPKAITASWKWCEAQVIPSNFWLPRMARDADGSGVRQRCY